MKLLLYCTKGKPYLYKHFTGEYFASKKYNNLCINNGTIPCECDFEVEEIRKECISVCKYCYRTKTLDEYDLMYKTQLDGKSMNEYLQGKGYAIHIKNLHIFDEPKELSDYYHNASKLEKAPQNMMYVFDGEEKKVLISIRPEWLCKILNGEKTIEVRKKVLKEIKR